MLTVDSAVRNSINSFQTLTYYPDAQWVQIQQFTFTNWINEQLRSRNVVLRDLKDDIKDGIYLVLLVEVLANKRIVNFVKNPQNEHEKLQNVSMSLDIFSRDGVRVTNIDSTDIVRGNIKVVLTLVWQLILRYQVGLSAVQHRQWFLKWLKAVLPEYHISNFGRDWNDGIALYALLEFCKSGICPNWDGLSRHDRLNNCRNAMKLATQHFDIPMVLRPEDLASPDLDERSAITYLSYFIKYGGPGYMATLERIQNRLHSKTITNFTTDWHDGDALAELVTSSGRDLPNIQEDLESPVEVIKKCINVGKYLGVEPVLTAEEITEETKEHLGIMTYAAQFLPHGLHSLNQSFNLHDMSFNKIHIDDNDSHFSTRTSTLTSNSIQQPNSSSNFHLVRHSETDAIDFAASEAFKIDCYSVGVIMETKLLKPFDPEKVKIEAIAPSGRVVKMTGDGHYSAQFMHTEIGEWKVAFYYKDKYLDGCPIDICDPSQVRVIGLKNGVVAKQQEFHIDCTKGGDGEVAVDVKHNGRQVVTSVIKQGKGYYRVTYTPYDTGPYSVDVTFNGAEVRDTDLHPYDPEERQRKAVFCTVFENAEHDKVKIKTSCDWEIDYMTGGPFVCHISDGSDIQVYGMNDGTVCSTPQLIADCSKVGSGILVAEVLCDNREFPAKITEERLNVYRVTFKPAGPGIYRIYLTYNGIPVKGTPFIQEIDELELPVVDGDGLIRGLHNQPSTFIIDPRGAPGQPTVNVLGPTRPVECHVEPLSNGTFKVYYTATERGQHHIDVRMDNKVLEGSPFKPWVVDPHLVRVSGGWKSLMGDGRFIPLVVNKEKHIPFDASEAGPGELTAEVRGPTGKIPVAIDARNDGRNAVIFTPRSEGHHDIDVSWSGFQLQNSPYPGWATYRPDVDIDTRLHSPPPPVHYAYTRSPPPSDFGSMRSDYPLVSIQGSDDTYRPVIKQNTMVKVLPNGISPNQGLRGPLKVILRGKGLKEAHIDKEAQFKIDGTQCRDGIPEAKISSQKTSIPVRMEAVGPRVFKCTYIPKVPGSYLLYIKWNEQPLRGSPFKVNVIGSHPAHRVRFALNKNQIFTVGKDVDITIDTRDAGPGELITKVIAPDGDNVEHILVNNPDGTRRLTFLPKTVGRYIVDVLYNDVHIHGSPYYIDIKTTGTTGEVRVWGPGIENGILGSFLSHFWVEANGAGAGELRVKIMGPKGAFHVKMKKAKKDEKLYQCFYNPIEAGIYTVYVIWSGEHIEGSPYTVLLAKNQEEIEHYQSQPMTHPNAHPPVDNTDVYY